MANRMAGKFGISERRTCRLLSVNRRYKRYRSLKEVEDNALTEKLAELAARWKRFGYRRLHVMLLREGITVNHKKVYRLYCKAGLSIRKKRKKCPSLKRGRPVISAATPNARWAVDFVSDATSSGQRFRVLTVIDEFTRECLALEVDTSITGRRVSNVLNRIMLFRDRPDEILSDNGSEFTSICFVSWARNNGISQLFTEPGKPTQNSFIESFNGKFRDECLNEHWFGNIYEAREIIENWRISYNSSRPHSALNYMTPAEYAQLAQVS